MYPTLDKDLNLSLIEEKIRTFWEREDIYRYDPRSSKPIFSIDTPPPYVSAAHLHIGHAMSYTQAEIIIRYKRMRGHSIFYPMGFDDNGLPTERYVEQLYAIDKRAISRSKFRELCIKETAKGAKEYEKLWRALALSVDWNLRYSTIDNRSRHTAQKSFIDLYKKGLVYRANEPVLWDTHFETSLAQADLETLQRKGKMYDIKFSTSDGTPIVISTTRPELMPACVGLFANPNDERYKSLIYQKAIVPLSNREVPILASDEVDQTFGTGLMMVCTFGDNEDVEKWKIHTLETRLIITPDGKMNDLAGKYAGLKITEARKEIVSDLSSAGLILAEQIVDQNVSVGERSNTPVEFMLTSQWFINILDHKDRLLNRAEGLNWFPQWMKPRLDQWIQGLRYNWNISRQRFYGVPFPIWYVKETGDIILADEKDLPVDPLESQPPAWAQEKYKKCAIIPETDVMDTWMTSSVSPLINANWAERNDVKGDMTIYPMSLRVQAFEIIRTWLFYTLIKSDYHTDSLPWKDVMISGWGLNEQGKKISKKDLENYTDESGHNRYDPYSLIKKYGADAVRYWAASSQLGHDLRFHERDIRDGRKIVVKLWNVARMGFMYMTDFVQTRDYIPLEERSLEDQWIITELNEVTNRITKCFDQYDYATARDILNKFFWLQYCDDYLELIKSRFWEISDWTEKDRRSAQNTLHESIRALIGLFAPYLPYITEEIYHQASMFGERYSSLHVSPWPTYDPTLKFERQDEMNLLLTILKIVRRLRSDSKVGSGTLIDQLILDVVDAPVKIKEMIHKLLLSIKGASRAMRITFGSATEITDITGLRISIIPYAEGQAPKISGLYKATS